MNLSRRLNSSCLASRLLAAGALVALAASLPACGGGGGSGGSSEGVTPAASQSQILIAPTSLPDLESLCAQKGARVVGPVEGTSYYIVEVPPGVDADDFQRDMDGHAECEDTEKDEGVQFPEGGGSTIPIFVDDGFDAIAIQPPMTTIGVQAAQARGFRGAGVVVAVIDTGIVASSPAMLGHVAPGGWDFIDNDADPTDAPNGIDDNGNGFIDEGVGHGTFVSSLILAVAPDAKILPIRALNSDAVGTASSVARGITYAVAHGANVINLSAGLTQSLLVIDQAVASAKAAGVLVVASAGNLSSPVVEFPASLTDVEAVTALDNSGFKASFASWGSSVDLCAPGASLLGAHPLSPSGTARWSGTSFSTALVTGSFALLRGHDLVSQSRDLMKRLEDTSTNVNTINPAYSGRLGKGLINLTAATGP
jgi:hypothetical protein